MDENGVAFNLKSLKTSSRMEVEVFAESAATSRRSKRSPDSMSNCTMVYAILVNNRLSSAQTTSQVKNSFIVLVLKEERNSDGICGMDYAV